MKDGIVKIPDENGKIDAYNGGVKMRVSWGIIERALKRDGVLGRSEYITAVEADEHGASFTLGRYEG